jgi:hypothetical protein
MTSQVFDNIQVTSLLNLLEEQVTLKRFYPLIPHKDRNASTLLSLEINDKYQYLEASQELREAFVQKIDLSLPVESARELFSLCDLMRLPGVKWLRAKLYYDCGYQSIQSFSQNDNVQIRNKIALYIQTNCPERGLPLPKEIATQIAVARALPHLYV